MMRWNWQQPDWPNFAYDAIAMASMEASFQRRAGIVVGSMRHLTADEKDSLVVDSISTEAIKTSEIEGEILNRDSVQSSVRRQLGLQTDDANVPEAERGIAEMMVSLYRGFEQPLSHRSLFEWHRMLTLGRTDLRNMGAYRTHPEAMQVVSGALYQPKIHFEAPPSNRVPSEMDKFVHWFNGSSAMPPLTRCGIAHLHFVSIHPFEDGNGRIARAISEKVLAQDVGYAALTALAAQIARERSAYYDALEVANKRNEVTDWLTYFGQVVLDAQKNTERQIQFLVDKAKWYGRLGDKLNDRQQKVVSRMFREGPEGFTGGLSAKNYVSIARTSTATATRDLRALVESGGLLRTGTRKSTRYWLNLKVAERP